MSSTRRSLLRALLGLGVGASLWLPTMHLAFRPARERLARGLLERHLLLWEGASQQDIARMRDSNPEWDFMGRTFLVLALANLALEDPALRDRHLAVIDRIVRDTLEAEREFGQKYFLMGYARARPFVHPSGRSLFVDGEVALMMAARLFLGDDPELRAAARERLAHIVRQMGDGAIGSAESYPEECWTFCNTTALAAILVADRTFGTDHRAFAGQWLSRAREALVDEETGLLVSSFALDGRHFDGPEGSSLWFAAHNLLLVDEGFAADQYWRARKALGRGVLGFGFAREWPASWPGPADVDSGPIVPLLGASAGSSGLALVGAGAFGDETFQNALLSSLNLAAFPIRSGDALAYQAGNQVADAVFLYALVQGPLWDAVTRGRA
jgi:hypothetical protein